MQVMGRCGVVGCTLAFGSIGHGFDSEHRLFHIMVVDINVVESGLIEARQKAPFLASSSQHSGNWLAVLPIGHASEFYSRLIL